MKKIFTFLSVLFVLHSNSQIFHKKYAYTNHIMNGATSCINNNRIYTASSDLMANMSLDIQKTDLNGNLIDAQQILWGSSGPAYTIRKMITSGDKLYIVGAVNTGTQAEALLVVLDTNLTSVLYSKTYGTLTNGEEFYDIIKTSSTDLVMVGHMTVPTATASVFRNIPYVVRASIATGNPVYQKAYDDGYYKLCLSVLEDPTNTAIYISGQMPSNAGSHIFKITDDNLGNVLVTKTMFFSGGQNLQCKKMQIQGSKLFMIGGDFNNMLVTMQTDLNLNIFQMPKYYTNFKYFDHTNVLGSNYIAGIYTPTTSTSFLGAIKMDSLFNPQISMTYSLVSLPLGYWNGINVVNKNATMYWIAHEAWTAPMPYTNRYIVASDMVLNAICNTSITLTTANLIQTATTISFTVPANSYTVISSAATASVIIPTITTLCSATGIENVNENFEKFVIKNGPDKVIVESPYSDFSITIFDVSGKLISSSASNAEVTEINTSAFANGIYIIQLNSKGYIQRQKFIKQ